MFGQSGANGPSATPPAALVVRNSDFATAPILLWLLHVMATQLRRLHAHQSPAIKGLAKILTIQVCFLEVFNKIFGK